MWTKQKSVYERVGTYWTVQRLEVVCELMPQDGRLRISKVNHDFLVDIKDSRELVAKLIDMIVDGSLDEDNDLKVDNQSVAPKA